MSSEVNTGLRGEDAQSRFQVLEKPVAAPGRCGVCGAVDRPVVDFGLDADFEGIGWGTFYMCVFCLTQAARKFPENDPANIISAYLLTSQLVSHEDFETWKHEYVEGLVTFVREFVPGAVPPVQPVSVDDSQVAETEPVSSPRSKSRSGKTAGQADDPLKLEGSTGVSSNSLSGFDLG